MLLNDSLGRTGGGLEFVWQCSGGFSGGSLAVVLINWKFGGSGCMLFQVN
jgi:hypothetical protein